MRLFRIPKTGLEVEVYTLERPQIGYDYLFHDCPHRIFNLLFLQILIIGY